MLERFDSRTLRSFRDRLLKWYENHFRPLPWRETHDPYRIWISEIMCQQTTVKAVIPYYERFLGRFPTIQDLASTSEAEVLSYWEGLGYYSRGRNLRLAAQRIRDQFGGRFPETIEEILTLPGIGRYTAGAIRSFAFDKPAPIVEANTLRLYCRLLGYDGDPRGKAGQALLWKFAELVQPRDRAGLLNQALMELGSQVCTPVSPACEECPVQRYCAAFAENRQHEIPAPKARTEMTPVVEATIAIQQQDRYLIRQRPGGERWAGMWDFPRFEMQSLTSDASAVRTLTAAMLKEIRDGAREQSGISIDQVDVVAEQRHTVTRYRIRLLCCHTTLSTSVSTAKSSDESSRLEWVTLEELRGRPMPVTGRKFVGMLESRDKNVLQFRS